MNNNKKKIFCDAKKWIQSIAREHSIDGKNVELNLHIGF